MGKDVEVKSSEKDVTLHGPPPQAMHGLKIIDKGVGGLDYFPRSIPFL